MPTAGSSVSRPDPAAPHAQAAWLGKQGSSGEARTHSSAEHPVQESPRTKIAPYKNCPVQELPGTTRTKVGGLHTQAYLVRHMWIFSREKGQGHHTPAPTPGCAGTPAGAHAAPAPAARRPTSAAALAPPLWPRQRTPPPPGRWPPPRLRPSTWPVVGSTAPRAEGPGGYPSAPACAATPAHRSRLP